MGRARFGTEAGLFAPMPQRRSGRGVSAGGGAAECPPAGHATAIFAVGQRSVAILGESVVGREEVQPQARQAPGAQPGRMFGWRLAGPASQAVVAIEILDKRDVRLHRVSRFVVATAPAAAT